MYVLHVSVSIVVSICIYMHVHAPILFFGDDILAMFLIILHTDIYWYTMVQVSPFSPSFSRRRRRGGAD
jgi:hypothetical protein